MLYQLSYARIRAIRLSGLEAGGKSVDQCHRPVASAADRGRRIRPATRRNDHDTGLLADSHRSRDSGRWRREVSMRSCEWKCNRTGKSRGVQEKGLIRRYRCVIVRGESESLRGWHKKTERDGHTPGPQPPTKRREVAFSQASRACFYCASVCSSCVGPIESQRERAWAFRTVCGRERQDGPTVLGE